ncbi:hypothetical protein F4T90_14200, partial [Acinetobacter junii]|nr:hypothetical protein [Acinetobacter junii]
NSFIFKFWGVSLSTHNVLSYAKRIDEICLGEWWQSRCRSRHCLFRFDVVMVLRKLDYATN